MKYIACICEGSAERAIMDLLLDNHMLIFERDDLIDGEILKCRKGIEFEEKYLRKGFSEKITVYRILDSYAENFKLSKAYKYKIDIVNVITSPEIEMLIIYNEGKYKEFKKLTNKNPEEKPSTYCKSILKYKDVKKYDFVYKYFSEITVLINALQEYRRVTKQRGNAKTLWDLLK